MYIAIILGVIWLCMGVLALSACMMAARVSRECENSEEAPPEEEIEIPARTTKPLRTYSTVIRA